ncbi:MAG: CHAD domain-containing protein [Edaphobacter sp.]
MASPAITARPIRILREMVTAIEAAIPVTIADPKPKSVHKLRAATRRIEAQLELISLLPNLPEHASPAKKARRLLKKLRRFAGRVRDLDVQYKLTQSKSPKLHQEAHHLRSLFKRQRDDEAERLLHILHKHQPKLTRALEDLLEALAAAEALTVPAARLSQLTVSWYTRNVPVATQNPDQLHAIRKSAKIARYMAESASPAAKPGAPTARLARTFEALQQSGGDWHDWLTLSSIARRELGPSSPLTQSFDSHRERSLRTYRRHLQSLPENLSLTTIPRKSPGLPG